MDNWVDDHNKTHSTLLLELGAHKGEESALRTLLEYLDLNEPLEQYRRMINENVTMEMYGEKVDTTYHINSTRLDNGKGSIYSINELSLY